jgi:hypothetical protein
MAFLKWLICHQGEPARGRKSLLQGSAAAGKGASFVAHPAHLSPHLSTLTELPSYSYSEVAEFRAPPGAPIPVRSCLLHIEAEFD